MREPGQREARLQPEAATWIALPRLYCAAFGLAAGLAVAVAVCGCVNRHAQDDRQANRIGAADWQAGSICRLAAGLHLMHTLLRSALRCVRGVCALLVQCGSASLRMACVCGAMASQHIQCFALLASRASRACSSPLWLEGCRRICNSLPLAAGQSLELLLGQCQADTLADPCVEVGRQGVDLPIVTTAMKKKRGRRPQAAAFVPAAPLPSFVSRIGCPGCGYATSAVLDPDCAVGDRVELWCGICRRMRWHHRL